MLVSENTFFILTLESGTRRKRHLNISFETYNRISFIENCIPRHSRAITERKITVTFYGMNVTKAPFGIIIPIFPNL